MHLPAPQAGASESSDMRVIRGCWPDASGVCCPWADASGAARDKGCEQAVLNMDIHAAETLVHAWRSACRMWRCTDMPHLHPHAIENPMHAQVKHMRKRLSVTCRTCTSTPVNPVDCSSASSVAGECRYLWPFPSGVAHHSPACSHGSPAVLEHAGMILVTTCGSTNRTPSPCAKGTNLVSTPFKHLSMGGLHVIESASSQQGVRQTPLCSVVQTLDKLQRGRAPASSAPPVDPKNTPPGASSRCAAATKRSVSALDRTCAGGPTSISLQKRRQAAQGCTQASSPGVRPYSAMGC